MINRKSKRIYSYRIWILLLLLLNLISCVDFYHNLRPKHNSTEVWVCDSPSGYFGWSSYNGENWLEPTEDFFGEITVNDTNYSIWLGFINGSAEVSVFWLEKLWREYYDVNGYVTGTALCGTQEALLFNACCDFSKDKLVMTVYSDSNGILAKCIDRLEFVRMEKTTLKN